MHSCAPTAGRLLCKHHMRSAEPPPLANPPKRPSSESWPPPTLQQQAPLPQPKLDNSAMHRKTAAQVDHCEQPILPATKVGPVHAAVGVATPAHRRVSDPAIAGARPPQPAVIAQLRNPAPSPRTLSSGLQLSHAAVEMPNRRCLQNHRHLGRTRSTRAMPRVVCAARRSTCAGAHIGSYWLTLAAVLPYYSAVVLLNAQIWFAPIRRRGAVPDPLPPWMATAAGSCTAQLQRAPAAAALAHRARAETGKGAWRGKNEVRRADKSA